MCGIAGIVSARPIDRIGRYLDGFSTKLRHRGPDDHGFLTWAGDAFNLGREATQMAPGRVALVHRRLSIIDLSERGWQPMVDESGRYAILFNGEIYNYPELRAELEAIGIRFRSESDTEVLLHLLMRHGVDALTRTVGMFALAFFDRTARRVTLARDPFGIKPLFYAQQPGTVAFASEIRPLLELGFAPRQVEPKSLFAYLRHAVTDHGEATLVAGVSQLRAAHALTIDADTGIAAAPQRYWAPKHERRPKVVFDEAGEELRALFSTSVRLHLRADVPVAATLSGGIDSSAIVAAARRYADDGVAAVFSYIADDPAIGEERFVDMVAQATGSAPHKIRLNADDLAEELDSLILTQEQPFGTTSIWAQSRVFARVRNEKFKVVLDGQGADELFAGYHVFRAARLAALVRGGHWLAAIRFARALPDAHALPLALGHLAPDGTQRFLRRLAGKPMMPAWLDGAWFARHQANALRPRGDRLAATDLIQELADATQVSSLPMLLRYADRNAMAVSIENRVPFLTTQLADFALSLPDEFLIGPEGTTKRLLRAAMRGIVPDAVLDRREKIGFATPEERWFGESSALRACLGRLLDHPLPPCFAPSLRDRLRRVVEGTARYGLDIWRCWNVMRWAELMRLEFPA